MEECKWGYKVNVYIYYILGTGHLQLADPTDVHMAQLCLSHFVPAHKRHQGTEHLGRCPTHQAYWPRYQAMRGMEGEGESEDWRVEIMKWKKKNKHASWWKKDRGKKIQMVAKVNDAKDVVNLSRGGM